MKFNRRKLLGAALGTGMGAPFATAVAPSSLNIYEEIFQVQRELRMFRQEYVPILAEHVPIDDSLAHTEMWAAPPDTTARDWQAATFSLADTLPLPPDDAGEIFKPEDYKGLYQEGDAHFQIRHGKLVWEIGIFMPVRLVDLSALHGGSYERVEQIVDWLLSLPLDDAGLWNGLCVLLPVVAMENEQLAWELLNPGFWTTRLRTDRNWMPLRDSNMDAHRFIRGLGFRRVLNNSMLHVLAALANNRFGGIARFLQLNTRRGGYGYLIPRYLFSVLCEKVLILKRLTSSGLSLDWVSTPPL